jgi:hypothetical protein
VGARRARPPRQIQEVGGDEEHGQPDSDEQHALTLTIRALSAKFLASRCVASRQRRLASSSAELRRRLAKVRE